MMPNKTIYVKDADLPLFEQAQELLGDSVSAMFAEFLRERVAAVDPEDRVVDLLKQIARSRAAAVKEKGLPGFIDAEYAEAGSYAERALKSLRTGSIRKAKVLLFGANTYFQRAERDAREARELSEKIAKMLGDN
jgi:hypothetical protein